MKKKSKSTTTTTPTNPTWVEPQIQNLTGKISGLANQDPGSFVAPANSLITQAGQGASTLAPNNQAYGSAQGLFQGLMNTGGQTVNPVTGNASSLLENLSSYMSPYTKDVVDSALADYDFGSGQTRAQNQLALAGDTTFGGSGGSIQTAMSNDAINRGRGALSGTLRDQAFNTGASLSGQDAARRQEMSLANMAAQNNASLANANLYEQALARQQQAGRDLVNSADAAQTAQNNAATTQANIGSILQQIQQQQAQAPLSVLSQLSGAYGNMTSPLSLLHGETSTSKSSSSGGLGGILGGLGSLAMGLGTGGLGFGLSGGLLGQMGAGSLAGLNGIGAGLNLSPVNVMTAA